MSQSIIDRVESSWQGFIDALDGIPDERMVEPGVTGDWSVKDLLGHVAFWESRTIAHLEREERGEPHPDGGGADFEPINQEQHRLRANQPLAGARDELQATHARLVALLGRVPVSDPGDIAGNTWDHYDEHAENIRGWRKQQGI